MPVGDVDAFSGAAESLIQDPSRRATLGHAAQDRARQRFSAGAIVPLYEALYRRVISDVRD